MVEFSSEITVKLIDTMGDDARIAEAARVSTKGLENKSDKIAGLVRALAREGHNCYDPETEVLTREGWKFWPDVKANDEFLTADLATRRSEYTPAEAVHEYDFDGELVKIESGSIDLMVTPNHRLVHATRSSAGWSGYSLAEARDVVHRAFKMPRALGEIRGQAGTVGAFRSELLGFIAGDGHVPHNGNTGSPSVHLHRSRKVEYLKGLIGKIVGIGLTGGECGRFRIVGVDEELKRLMTDTYNDDGTRRVPRRFLNDATAEEAHAFLTGYLNADGSIREDRGGSYSMSAVGGSMLNGVSQLAATVGKVVVVGEPQSHGKTYASKHEHSNRAILSSGRNDHPRIGWTKADRERQVKNVEYSGKVYCATVPHGTLYVRRNGKPVWSGNSPFEHSVMTVSVEAPIFVAREWMRHRTQCIAGDTEVSFSTGKPQGKDGSIGIRRKTIAEHWEHFNLGILDSLGRRRVLPSVKNATVVSMNEETGERAFSRVLDVIQSGVKPVYRMTTERGKTVKATADHKFLTSSGWARLGDIEVGNELITQHRGFLDRQEDRTVPWSLRQAINTWTTSVREEIFVRDEWKCQSCGVFVTLNGGRCDHRIPVIQDLEKALSKSNLQTLCIQCNTKKTNSEQGYTERGERKAMHFSPDRVKSMTFVGDEMTYDLVLDDPHHNFLGNGIVTHNSYSEISARYTQLQPKFYLPSRDRKIVQAGKALDYRREPGTIEQGVIVEKRHEWAAREAWDGYQRMLEKGVANEVARNVLPVSVYTQFWATANLNNWFKFLTLRDAPNALAEIREGAEQVDALISELWPVAWRAFHDFKQQEEK